MEKVEFYYLLSYFIATKSDGISGYDIIRKNDFFRSRENAEERRKELLEKYKDCEIKTIGDVIEWPVSFDFLYAYEMLVQFED